MKTNLFFFSATGNSLIVAKDIAAKLPDTQIFSIPKVINGQIDLDADIIGLVFPVYFAGMPRIVIDFINKLKPSKIKYLFAICTCGAFPAGTLLQTQEQLKSMGLSLNAGFSIQMPGNYLVRYGAFTIEKQKELFSKEKAKIETIVTMVKNQQENKIEQNNRFINLIGKLVYQSKFPKFPTLDHNFTVNEKCNNCKTCEKVCPVQNIRMIDNKPIWQRNCEHCLACIQWCPTEAIQYGTKTANRKRYRYPEISVTEIYRS